MAERARQQYKTEKCRQGDEMITARRLASHVKSHVRMMPPLFSASEHCRPAPPRNCSLRLQVRATGPGAHPSLLHCPACHEVACVSPLFRGLTDSMPAALLPDSASELPQHVSKGVPQQNADSGVSVSPTAMAQDGVLLCIMRVTYKDR